MYYCSRKTIDMWILLTWNLKFCLYSPRNCLKSGTQLCKGPNSSPGPYHYLALALQLFCLPRVLLFYPNALWASKIQVKAMRFPSLILFSLLFHLSPISIIHMEHHSFTYPPVFSGTMVHPFMSFLVFTVWWEPNTPIVWDEMVRLVYME